jgi:hypothetical protein
LALSLFGLLITLGLATYNDRNDQHYDALVGRAASIEWQLGLFDGAFANRPTSWFGLEILGVRWRIDHRGPVTLIYCASVGLWVFSTSLAAVQLAWGNESAPRGVMAAAIVPAIAVPLIGVRSIRSRRRQTAKRVRLNAALAVERAVDKPLGDLALDGDFVRSCGDLSGVSFDHAQARARFYSRLPVDERRQFMPNDPMDLRAAHFVALISDLPAEWIDDCYRERRKDIRQDAQQAQVGAAPPPDQPIDHVAATSER